MIIVITYNKLLPVCCVITQNNSGSCYDQWYSYRVGSGKVQAYQTLPVPTKAYTLLKQSGYALC